jgi:alpha/beta superfamily hydrolase
MKYREFPVFVPAGDRHLCAVVSAPTGESRGLAVVLLTGGNVTRSHRNGMWVRAARILADHGYPSIRFDYHGVGDSPGTARIALDRPFVKDLDAAASFLRQATGVTRLALVATCFGARTAIATAAAREDIVSLTMFPTPLLGGVRMSRSSKARQQVRRSRLGRAVLRLPLVLQLRRRRAARRQRASRRQPIGTISPRVVEDLATFLRRGTAHFVYGERAQYLAELRECVALLEQRLGPREQARLVIEVVPGAELHRFATLQEQDVVISRAVGSVLEADVPTGPATEGVLSRSNRRSGQSPADGSTEEQTVAGSPFPERGL